MTTCNITGTAGLPDGTILASATFRFVASPKSVVSSGGRVVTPRSVSVVSGDTGLVDFDLVTGNYIGTETSTGANFEFVVPDAASADWTDCISAAAIIAPTEYPASQVTMSGGGTVQDYAGFATRAAFVTWAGVNTPAFGAVINAGGFAYLYLGTGTAISDLSGWVPNGQAYPDHWKENTTPGTTDMVTAIQSALDWSGLGSSGSQGRDSVRLQGRTYAISAAVTMSKDFAVLEGVDERSSLLVALSDFGPMVVCSAADPTTTALNQPTVKNIGFRYFADSAALIGIKLVRCVGAKVQNIDTHSLWGGISIEGGINIDLSHWTHTFGIYSSAVKAGSFAVKTRKGVGGNLTPSNIFLTNCDLRTDDQANPRMDAILDLGEFDGITFANTHLLGGAGKGNIYIQPQTDGAKCTWLKGDVELDGGSTYGIYCDAPLTGTPLSYGNFQLTVLASRQSINHFFAAALCGVRDVDIKGLWTHAGDSAIVLEGGSHFNFGGKVNAAGQNGTSGKKSGLVMKNDVHHVTSDLQFTNDTTLTMTTGVEVLTNTVDYIHCRGSAWGMANPVSDDFSYVSGTNTGSKVYKIESEKDEVFTTAVTSSAIQRKPYASLVELDPSDTTSMNGMICRFAGAVVTVVCRSTRTFTHTASTTGLRLKGGVNFSAVDQNTITFRYSTLRGWVEIARTA